MKALDEAVSSFLKQTNSAAAPAELLDAGRRLLEIVLANAASIEAVLHPLGFIYLPLSKQGIRKVRCHIWPTREVERRDPLSAIHDHSWHLESLVLCGCLIDQQFTPEPSSATHGDYQVWEVEYGDGRDALVPTGEWIKIPHKHQREICPGQQYVLDPGTLHTTLIEGPRPVATIVVATETSAPSPRVLGGGESEVATSERRACPTNRLKEAVESALQHMTAEG